MAQSTQRRKYTLVSFPHPHRMPSLPHWKRRESCCVTTPRTSTPWSRLLALLGSSSAMVRSKDTLHLVGVRWIPPHSSHSPPPSPLHLICYVCAPSLHIPLPHAPSLSTSPLPCPGSFLTASCTRCKYSVSGDDIKEEIMNEASSTCAMCGSSL